MRKHEYTVENQDPLINARIKAAMTKLLEQQLTDIELLAANPIEDKSQIDPRSSNAGKHYLENRKGYENAMAARTRRIRDLVSSVEQLRVFLVLPKPKPNPVDHEAEKRAELEAMIESIETDSDE